MDEKFPLALPEGTILAGQYMIEKVLGQGGFGITYRAIDHKTNQKVAVKEFFPDTLAYREMTTVISYPGERSESYVYGKESFLQEAQTLAEFIGNENIVRIHSYFEENGTAYFVMDYIEGKSFDEYIKEKGGKISVDEAKKILIPMMDALNVVHSKGIVHRDVTPDNIYLTNDGTVKLLDFGAARYSLGDKSRSLDVILKHGFAPKEQYTRRGKQGPFTDIYSLGATFYFAITGKRPPDSVERLDEDDLIPPSNLGVDITEYQERAILQALSVQPAERFQTMADFKSVLLNESNVKNQIIFTSPEKTVGTVGINEQTVAYQQYSVTQNTATAQNAEPLVQKKKKNNNKLIIAIACVLVVILCIGYAVSGIAEYKQGNMASGGSVSDETGKEGYFSDSAIENKIPDKDGLTIVGNTPANIKNEGIAVLFEDNIWWIDNNKHDIYAQTGDNAMCVTSDNPKEYSCLSYYDGIMYWLCDGVAFSSDEADTEGIIPELERYENIERLYITPDFYFIYIRDDEKLYRISQKTGKEEDSIAISSSAKISFYDGWLYYVENSDGVSMIRRVWAGDFDNSTDNAISITQGYFSELVIDGDYGYVIMRDKSKAKTVITRFHSDLKVRDDECSWDISDFVNTGGQNSDNTAAFLNVEGDNLFFSVANYNNNTMPLWHIIVDKNSYGPDSGYTYELVESGFACNSCIIEYDKYYKLLFYKLDGNTNKLTTQYKDYKY